jgi:multidrug resistance efflux pump
VVVFTALGLVVAGAGTAAAFWWGGLLGKEPFNGPTATVVRKVLQVTIVERGELASAKNSDIICTVRARSANATVATTIKWLVDNGWEVKKGDKVIELDDSGLQEQLKTQKITVDQARADWKKADEQYNIDNIKTQTDVEKAKNDRDLAKIDVKKYKEGEYVQNKTDLQSQIDNATSDYEQARDRAAWSRRMVKKGFISQSQADAEANKEEGARNALVKAKLAMKVLEDKTWGVYVRTVQDLKTKVDQAERNLKMYEIQKEATLAQDDVIRLSKKSTYEQELARQRDLENEITKCVITAPQDGLVVYYIPEQTRFGQGAQQGIIAQGEPVREGQKLMQIPDLSEMLVKVNVPEAKVAYLHSEEDPKDRSTWQLAQIRPEAFSSRILHGHVKFVENQASQLNFFASDVGVYKTTVTIDDSVEDIKLRAGMKAEVTILAKKSPEPVLVVPIQSVVGTIAAGQNRQVFVLSGGQPALRNIVVGMSNEREVEVQPWDEEKKTGLKEGEAVVLNPRPLLGADSDMKPGKVRTRKGEGEGGDDGSGRKNGKKKGDGSKGPAGPGGATIPGKGSGSTGPAPGAGGAKGPGGFDPAAIQRMQEQFMAELRPLTAAQRRDRINQKIPEPYRAKVRQAARAGGLEVAD